MTRSEAAQLVKDELGDPLFASKFVTAAKALGMLKLDDPKSAFEKLWQSLIDDFGYHEDSRFRVDLEEALRAANVKLVEK